MSAPSRTASADLADEATTGEAADTAFVVTREAVNEPISAAAAMSVRGNRFDREPKSALEAASVRATDRCIDAPISVVPARAARTAREADPAIAVAAVAVCRKVRAPMTDAMLPSIEALATSRRAAPSVRYAAAPTVATSVRCMARTTAPIGATGARRIARVARCSWATAAVVADSVAK